MPAQLHILYQTHVLKLQGLQNKVIRSTSNFPRHTLFQDMHVALKIPYVYDFITVAQVASKTKSMEQNPS
jgi:hypothetical protein